MPKDARGIAITVTINLPTRRIHRMSTDPQALEDPRTRYPQPEFDAQKREYPGSGDAMRPVPDHGERTYRGSGKLVGRAAVVTGADSGIGRAVCIAFAREGADVVLSYLPEEQQQAEETANHVNDAGRTAVLLPGDVSDEAQCRSIVQHAAQQFGHIDVLVNNAAFQMAQKGGLADITTEQLDRTFKTNVYAMFWLCKAALPHMRPGASIINTSSIEAYNPKPALLDYAATKGAIVNFTKGFAIEAAEKGIRVNTVAPGPIWTPLIPATMPPDDVKTFGGQVPLKRPGQPAELAPAYVFLASNDSSYVTGEVLGVTGGGVLA
jgi:NAD(P)-dependent dehydrogenase (short-subunit alcohol dehydrogenase family)